MTDPSIPDATLAAMQARADEINAALEALELAAASARITFSLQRDELREQLKRIKRAARAYRGETERKK